MRKLIALIALIPACALAQSDDILLGAGVRTRPEFDGSGSRKTDLIPVVRYYGRPWFARTTQGLLEGGARWSLRPGFDVGAQIAYEQGPMDHDPGASVGVHAEWDRKLGSVPIDGLVRVRQHLDSDRGIQLDARVTAGVYGSHGIQAGVFGQFTLASEKSVEAYYGVKESGLLFTSLGALASYDLARRWVLVGSIERRTLSDDVAKSPIVERRSSAYASVGLAYRF